MKKLLALCLVAVMLLGLAGCGSDGKKTASEPTLDGPQGAYNGGYTFPTIGELDLEATEPEETLPPVELEELGYISQANEIKHNELEYVMVYNPYVYDEYLLNNPTLSTGRIEDQIMVDMNRGDGLTEEPEFMPVGQNDLQGLTLSGQLEQNRADALGKVFRKGDTHQFFTYSSLSMSLPRTELKFTCVYAGEFCNIWSYNNSISQADAQACGEEFDTNIYEKMVEKFGTPRFNSQVNFLYYPMQDGILGCFWGGDLLLEEELPYFGLENGDCNTGVNVLHMNSRYEALDPNSISTLAHEFQHLICFTNAFGTVYFNQCNTWLNEAMSGYVEEMLYPTIQLQGGRMDSLMDSDLIRYGQSLYNFTTKTESFEDWDIGVYGSVYLYSMYLERLAGENVFANFHSYWRNSYSETLSVAEALVNSVPEEVYAAVDESVRYPTAVLFDGFANEQEQWMSKLTLQFYLDMLDADEADPVDFGNVDSQRLVYDQLDPATIEGGGRVILQVKGDSYKIPTLAGRGLVYVALDADFNVLSISYN